jgi:tRNA(fMet)-specific endonuclease VapC
MILLDTDHCIFFLRGHAAVVEAFAHQRDETPAISIITVGELYYGALRSSRPDQNLVRCDAFLEHVEVVNLERSIMLRFARIKAALAQRGEPIEDPDLLIAATALAVGAPLVTHNLSHFQRIPGLRLLDWTQ